MKNNPLVSIVIPTYNKAKHIKKAIGGVLSQTYQNLEVIVIDDGSTDNTQEVVKSFNDPRIIYIWQENKGPAAARNTGIKKTQGKYIAFLDSDDFWLKEKLEKQVRFLEENPEVGLLGSGCYQLDEKGEVIGEKIFPAENKVLQKILIKYNPFIQSSVILRKEVFDRMGKYDENFLQSEDYELWLRIAKSHKIANLSEPLVKKRYYKESLLPGKDKEQLSFALKAKEKAILSGQYPKWCYMYLFGSWLFLKIPFFIRKIIRKYILKKKFYG
ncbi:MAG: glycosyltransferase [Patescibacteria group bacterium]|nr:glycosyltransferase [Patescibacteria group bacterium]